MVRKLSIFIALLFVSYASFAQFSGDLSGLEPVNPDGGDYLHSGQFQDYTGATGPGDFCPTCALENRSDAPTGKNRFLLNNDYESINRRCQELGWSYGQALQVYSHLEWCRYGNARTRTWDPYNYQWSFGRCAVGNVKLARCFR